MVTTSTLRLCIWFESRKVVTSLHLSAVEVNLFQMRIRLEQVLTSCCSSCSPAETVSLHHPFNRAS